MNQPLNAHMTLHVASIGFGQLAGRCMRFYLPCHKYIVTAFQYTTAAAAAQLVNINVVWRGDGDWS